MIKSAKQLAVTRRRIAEFETAIAEFEKTAPPSDSNPLPHVAALEALKSLKSTLLREVTDYEVLVASGVPAINYSGISDLPKVLVQLRIAKKLSQKDLADRLQIAPQQIQRWEADEYENAGLAYVVEIGNALDVDTLINDAARRPQLPTQAQFSLADKVRSWLANGLQYGETTRMQDSSYQYLTWFDTSSLPLTSGATMGTSSFPSSKNEEGTYTADLPSWDCGVSLSNQQAGLFGVAIQSQLRQRLAQGMTA